MSSAKAVLSEFIAVLQYVVVVSSGLNCLYAGGCGFVIGLSLGRVDSVAEASDGTQSWRVMAVYKNSWHLKQF